MSLPQPGNQHILIQALASAAHAPLPLLTSQLAEAGCNLVDAHVFTLATNLSIAMLAEGPWSALARLESSLTRLARHPGIRHLVWYRTGVEGTPNQALPYLVEIICADRSGILATIVDFFSQHGVHIDQLTSSRYQAMYTGAHMFQAQLTVSIPPSQHIASLREAFLDLCDNENFDAILDPVKF